MISAMIAVPVEPFVRQDEGLRSGPGKGGVGTIAIDGNRTGEGRIEKTQPGVFSVDDLADVGTDDGTPVTDYGKSRKFTGTLNKVTIKTNE